MFETLAELDVVFTNDHIIDRSYHFHQRSGDLDKFKRYGSQWDRLVC